MGSGELRSQMETQFGPALSKVEWIGFQPWDKLPEFYAKADVFCFPSRYDGWGLALVEALASGLPVISTDQTGAALEFIKSKENGWLIAAGNEAALTQAMLSALEMSEDQRQEMSKKARNSVSKHSLKDGCTTFIDSSMKALTGVFDS
jgi:glycosyltransferase involved in cell wall biosynthesis